MRYILHFAYFALAAACVAARTLHGPDPYMPQSSGILYKRERRSLCNKAILDELEKAHHIQVHPRALHNGTLLDRTMKTPDSDADIDVESWVLEETNILENTFRFTDVTGSYDANSAEFKPLGDEPFSYNIVGLTGCTAMVLLSKRGIYIAHYFENIAFNKDRNSPYKSQQTAFLHTVQQGLRRGRLNEQVSLASNAIAIDDDSLHGFLIIPKTGPGNDNTQIVEDPYREWWEKIKTTVGSILPRLNDPGRWHEYKYAPQQEEQIVRDEQGEAIYEPIWATSSGRVLFKYDPDHNGRKKTLLYFEKERMEAANMEW